MLASFNRVEPKQISFDENLFSSHNIRAQLSRMVVSISSTDKQTNFLEEMKFNAHKISLSLVSSILTTQVSLYTRTQIKILIIYT